MAAVFLKWVSKFPEIFAADIFNKSDGSEYFFLSVRPAGDRDIRTLGELSIVNETFSFCMMVCAVTETDVKYDLK